MDLGLALRLLPTGHLGPNVPLLFRNGYTQKLEATYPWVDTVDPRLFLICFGAGEQFVLHNYSEAKELVEST